MPRNACRYVNVDHVAPIAEIPGLLYRLATEPGAAETEHGTSAMSSQEEIIKEDLKSAKPSAHTCPECGGPLFQIEDGALLRYRCRVGHAYGSDSFSYAQKESTESRLWSALQSLMSQADIEEKTGELTQSSGELSKAQIYRERSKQSRRAAELLQQVIKLAQHSELEKPDYD